MSEDEADNLRRIAMQLCEAFEPPQPLLEYQQTPLPYPVEALGNYWALWSNDWPR